MSKPIDISISGPLLSAPSLMGGLMAIIDSGYEIGNIYASGGGVLVALIFGSGYRPDSESVRALSKISSLRITKRTYRNLWLSPIFKSHNELKADLDKFFSKSFESFKNETFFVYGNSEFESFVELGFTDGIRPIDMLLPILNVNGKYETFRLLGKSLASLETSALLAKYLKNINADVYLRGVLDVKMPSVKTVGNPSVLDRTCSKVHLPEAVSGKTIFLNCDTSTDSFFGLSQGEINNLVNTAFSHTSNNLSGVLNEQKD